MGLDVKSTCPTTYVKESSSTLLPPFLKKKYNIEWDVIQYSIANLDNHPRLSFFFTEGVYIKQFILKPPCFNLHIWRSVILHLVWSS